MSVVKPLRFPGGDCTSDIWIWTFPEMKARANWNDFNWINCRVSTDKSSNMLVSDTKIWHELVKKLWCSWNTNFITLTRFNFLSHREISSIFSSCKAHEKGVPTFVWVCWVILVVEITDEFLHFEPEFMVQVYGGVGGWNMQRYILASGTLQTKPWVQKRVFFDQTKNIQD